MERLSSRGVGGLGLNGPAKKRRTFFCGFPKIRTLLKRATPAYLNNVDIPSIFTRTPETQSYAQKWRMQRQKTREIFCDINAYKARGKRQG